MKDRKSATISRESLYAQVWTTPVDRLAKTFGISGRGLGKICVKLDIPVPPRGYWARLAAGQKVTTYRLPPRKDGIPAEVNISETYVPDPPQPLPTAVEEAVKAQPLTEVEIKLAKTLSNPHRIVAAWIERDRREREQDRFSTWSRPKEPASVVELRKHRYLALSNLFKELERRGYKVISKEIHPCEFSAEISGQSVVFELDEYVRQVRRQLTPEETKKSYDGKRKWSQDRIATGKLRFRVTAPYGFHGYKTEWIEDEASSIEIHFAEILTSMIAVAALKTEQAREQRIAEEKRWKEEQERYAREQAKKHEAACLQHIVDAASDWSEANRTAAFLDVLEAEEKRRLGVDELPEEATQWLRWAREKVAADNPAIRGLTALIEENSAVEAADYVSREPRNVYAPTPARYPFWLRHR